MEWLYQPADQDIWMDKNYIVKQHATLVSAPVSIAIWEGWLPPYLIQLYESNKLTSNVLKNKNSLLSHEWQAIYDQEM